MQESQLLIALVFGLALIALGLVPGLLQQLVDGTRNLTENFQDELNSNFPRSAKGAVRAPKLARNRLITAADGSSVLRVFLKRAARQVDYEKLPEPAWLALPVIGLILLGVFAYITRT